MMEHLTPRQRENLGYIVNHTMSRGYPPSVREICREFGLALSTAHSHLAVLERKGYIHRDRAKPRAIRILHGEAVLPRKRVVPVPIDGRVSAGKPVLALEDIEDVFPLPGNFLDGEEVFLFEVKGDSMRGAGIHDRDLLLVHRQEAAKKGDIVVALPGEEAIVRRYYWRGRSSACSAAWTRREREAGLGEAHLVKR